MICPNELMQMHQKARIGDGEANDVAAASWSMQECPVCGRQAIEFHAVIVVGSTEEARTTGGMLVATAMESVAT